MIEKIKGEYHLVCDVCGEEAPEPFYDFMEAVNFKKAHGWQSNVFKVEGHPDIWQDVCPDCQELEE